MYAIKIFSYIDKVLLYINPAILNKQAILITFIICVTNIANLQKKI